MAVGVRSQAVVSLRCRDGAHRVFADRADICLHQAPSGVRCSASRMKGRAYEADVLEYMMAVRCLNRRNITLEAILDKT